MDDQTIEKIRATLHNAAKIIYWECYGIRDFEPGSTFPDFRGTLDDIRSILTILSAQKERQ